MSSVLNEVQIMHRLASMHAIKFHTWYETSKHVWLILEYCTGSDLATLLQQDLVMPESAVKVGPCPCMAPARPSPCPSHLPHPRPSTPVPRCPVVQILGTDLMAGQHYLHARGVLFCDLKPSNVLVDEFGVPKLASFRLARRVPVDAADEATKPSSRRPGTPCYMAPELFMADGTPSFASDAWSLGCVLFELATGRPPFVNSSLQRLIHQIMCDDPPLPAASSPGGLARGKRTGLSACFLDLLGALLCKDPVQRLCWPQLREHPFWEASLLPRAAAMPPQPLFEARLAQRRRDPSHVAGVRGVVPMARHPAVSPDRSLSRVRTPASAPVAPHPHAQSSFIRISDDGAALARSEAVSQRAMDGSLAGKSRAPEAPGAGDETKAALENPGDVREGVMEAAVLRLSLNASRNLLMQQRKSQSKRASVDGGDAVQVAGGVGGESARATDHGDVQLENPDAEVDFGNSTQEEETAASTLHSPMTADCHENIIMEAIVVEEIESGSAVADDSQAAEVEDELEAEEIEAMPSADAIRPPRASDGRASGEFARVPSAAPTHILGAGIRLRASAGDYAALETAFMGKPCRAKQASFAVGASSETLPAMSSMCGEKETPLVAQILLLRPRPDGTHAAALAQETALFGSIAPVVFNATIDSRCTSAPKYRAAALPFAAPPPAEVAQFAQEGLEQFLGVMYRALAAAAPAAQKANIASYTHALAAASPKLANLLVNSSFVTLLTKLARRCRSDALRARLVLLVGDLVRHATYILPDGNVDSENSGASAPNTMLGCLTDLLFHGATAGGRSPAGECGTDALDDDAAPRVRRRAMAALGELLFYISSTQVAAAVAAGNGAAAAPALQWHMPAATISAVVHCLRAGDECLDETLRHCAVRTLQNIFAQAASAASAAAARLLVSQRANLGQTQAVEVPELAFVHVECFFEAGVGVRLLSIVRDAPGSGTCATALRASAATALAAMSRLILVLGILEQSHSAAQVPTTLPVVSAARLAQLSSCLTQGLVHGEPALVGNTKPSAEAFAETLCDGLMDCDVRVSQAFLLLLHILLLPLSGATTTQESAPDGVLRVWRAIAVRLPVLLPSLISLISRSPSPSAAVVGGANSNQDLATSLCTPCRTLGLLVLSQLFNCNLQHACGGTLGNGESPRDLSSLALILSCCAGGTGAGRNARELSLIRVVARLGHALLAAGNSLLGANSGDGGSPRPAAQHASCLQLLSHLECSLAEASRAAENQSTQSPRAAECDGVDPLSFPFMHMAVCALNMLANSMLLQARDVMLGLAGTTEGDVDDRQHARYDALLLPLYLIEDGGSEASAGRNNDGCELGFRYHLVTSEFLAALSNALLSAAHLQTSWPDSTAPVTGAARELPARSPPAPLRPEPQRPVASAAARACSSVQKSSSPALGDHRTRAQGATATPHKSPEAADAVAVPSPRCPSPWFGLSSAREVAAACDTPFASGNRMGGSGRGPVVLLLLEAVQCHLLHGVSDVSADVECASFAMEGALEEAALSLAAARQVHSLNQGWKAVRRLPTKTASHAASCATRAARAAQSLQAAHVVRSKWAWQMAPAFARDVIPALTAVCKHAPDEKACLHGLRMALDVVVNLGDASVGVSSAGSRGGTVARWVHMAGDDLNDTLRTTLGQSDGFLPCSSKLLKRDAAAIKQVRTSRPESLMLCSRSLTVLAFFLCIQWLLHLVSEVLERWPDLLGCFASAPLLDDALCTIAGAEERLTGTGSGGASNDMSLIASSWRLLRAALQACGSRGTRAIVASRLLLAAGSGGWARACILRNQSTRFQDLGCVLDVLQSINVVLAEVVTARRSEVEGSARAAFDQADMLLAPLLDEQCMHAIAAFAVFETGVATADSSGAVASALKDAEWHGMERAQPHSDKRRRIADAASGVLLASGLVSGDRWSSLFVKVAFLKSIADALGASGERSVGTTALTRLLRSIR